MYRGKYSFLLVICFTFGIVLLTNIINSSSIDVKHVSPEHENQETIASESNEKDSIDYNSDDKIKEDSKLITNSQKNLNLSSISLDKTIIWFCSGAIGYTVSYAIGKKISDK